MERMAQKKNTNVHLETMEEQERAFSDTLIRIKQESLAEKNKNWDPTDMSALQELVKGKKDLEELGSSIGVVIRCQHEDIFNMMHRI